MIFHSNTQEKMTTSLPNIVKEAEEYILDLFNEKGNTQLLFHDYRRGAEVAYLIQDISKNSGLNEVATEIEIAKIASWFYVVGKLFQYEQPHLVAKQEAIRFLKEKEYSPEKLQKVIQCIDSIDTKVIPQNTECQLVHDASLAYWTTSNNIRLAPLIRLENELISGNQWSHLEWEEKHLNDLLAARFYTPYGQLVFTPILNQNIVDQKKRVDSLILKTKRKKVVDDSTLRKFQGLEDKIPQRANQTFFRAVYRNHINLSAIADNKANMMTGINAILLSVVLSIVTYTRLIYDKTETVMPITIFILTALVSLIFSVAAASPKITKVNKKVSDKMKARKNIAFFGNFTSLSLEEFEEAMDAMLRDDELIYGNMTRDLYFLGKALDTKYRLLRISYHVFLGGFVTSVLLFTYFAFIA